MSKPTQAFIFFLLSLLILPNFATRFLATKTPIIAIISSAEPDTQGYSYIKTTYVEFVRTSGAQVIPIPWDLEEPLFSTLLGSVNGVLWTGGMADLWTTLPNGTRTFSPFQLRLQAVYNFAVSLNDKGVKYPIWAICQGHEAMGLIITQDPWLLDTYVQQGKLAPVIPEPGSSNSYFFSHFTPDTLDFIANGVGMLYGHMYGINTTAPSLYPSMGPDQYATLAKSKDDNGKEFIAVQESLKYPFYMHMFHIERMFFDYNHLADHGGYNDLVVKVATQMSQTIFDVAALNNNKFPSDDLKRMLYIENFDTMQFQTYGLHYFFTKNSLNDAWNAYQNQGQAWWILLIIIGIGIGAYYGVKWVLIPLWHKKKHPIEGDMPLLNPDAEIGRSTEMQQLSKTSKK